MRKNGTKRLASMGIDDDPGASLCTGDGMAVLAAPIDPAAYALAYGLAVEIDRRVTTGAAHYRSRGVLLRTLDEVVRAMIEGELETTNA